jgi:hypothetical protein
MRKTTIYFGRDIVWPDGSKDYVDDISWNGFLKEVVDKNFDGYTYREVFGSWKGNIEDSFELVIIHEVAYENASKITDIAETYKRLFNQEAILIEFIEIQTVTI